MFFILNDNFLGHNLNQIVDNPHNLTVIILSLMKLKIDPTILQNVINVIFHIVDWLNLFPEPLVWFHLLRLWVFDHQVLQVLVECVVDE